MNQSRGYPFQIKHPNSGDTNHRNPGFIKKIEREGYPQVQQKLEKIIPCGKTSLESTSTANTEDGTHL